MRLATRSGRCCWPGGYCPPRCAQCSWAPDHTAGRPCCGERGSGTRRSRPWPPSPRRLAAFALAVDQPDTAAAALARLPEDDRSRPALAARLAWEQGQLTEALQALEAARTRRARRLRATLAAEQVGPSMIVSSFGQITAISAHDHELSGGSRPARREERVPGRVLHLVTDALPATSAGYTSGRTRSRSLSGPPGSIRTWLPGADTR